MSWIVSFQVVSIQVIRFNDIEYCFPLGIDDERTLYEKMGKFTLLSTFDQLIPLKPFPLTSLRRGKQTLRKILCVLREQNKIKHNSENDFQISS